MPMLSVVVAAVQTNSGDDIDRNLAAADGYARTAAAEGATLVALPECFALMPSDREQYRQHAEVHGDGKIQNFLADLSRELKVWLIAGTLPLRSHDPKRIFNTLLVYDDHGKNVARYDKIHLFDVALPHGEHYRESEHTMPGGECVTVPTPVGELGLSVCYDLRFAELYRALSARGATVLTVPSAFSCTTGAHWPVLLRARAIENLCYVIAPAQTGKHPGDRRTFGHSLIIDPWGEVLAEQKTAPGVLLAEISPGKIADRRAQLPSLSHHRAELFL